MGKYHVYYQVMPTVIAIESIFGNTAWLHTVKTVYLTIESKWSVAIGFFCVCLCVHKSTEEK